MLNFIWVAMILISIIVGFFTGNLNAVTDAAIQNGTLAVEIAIGLIGIMAFWLGVMKIAEHGGIIKLLSKMIKPLSRLLFPNIPSDHPAIGTMLMNVVANWLGLGNAATPLGLKAMEELQKINPEKDTASNAQIIFLAINTASITFIPITVIGVRTKFASMNPFEIISTSIFASTCACITAITVAKIMQRLPWFRKTDPGILITSEKKEEKDA